MPLRNFKVFGPEVLLSIILVITILSCGSEEQAASEPESVELEVYETIVAYDDALFGNPIIIRYDDNSNLLVYDNNTRQVLKLNENSEIVERYGRQGRGPGEFIVVYNIFPVNDHIYLLDPVQHFLLKFSQNGDYISTLDYGSLLNLTLSSPLPPFPRDSFLANLSSGDINDQPRVTLDEKVLLFTQNDETMYELVDWEGNFISEIGEVPEGSAFERDDEIYRSEISNREIPSLFKSSTFTVNDAANPEEYFLIYNTIPMIAKYNSAGQKLWEKEVTETSEISSIENSYYEAMDQALDANDVTVKLRKYTSGVSSEEGDLYLATYSYPGSSLWIHQFNNTGELVRRYRLISEDADILPIFDIDFTGQFISVVTEDAEIRAYSF